MTQSTTATRRGASLRKHYRSPAHMRATADVLKNPPARELTRLGAKRSPAWREQADRLEREATRWESERRT